MSFLVSQMAPYIIFFIDFISFLLLLGVFYLMWKERLHFYSLRPLLPAIVFLTLSHICDMLVEHPNIRLSDYFGLSLGSFELAISIIGNIADTVGITFLIYCFIKIIKYKRAEKKHIHDLERMLPLFAHCKKYRTEEDQWLPIEKYLVDSGAPQLTHGICREGSAKFYGGIHAQQLLSRKAVGI
jgi:hypothetical protein